MDKWLIRKDKVKVAVVGLAGYAGSSCGLGVSKLQIGENSSGVGVSKDHIAAVETEVEVTNGCDNSEANKLLVAGNLSDASVSEAQTGTSETQVDVSNNCNNSEEDELLVIGVNQRDLSEENIILGDAGAPRKKTKKRKHSNSNRLNKFCNSWMADPEFSQWLAKSKNGENGHEYACCRVCHSDITAHRNDIYRHSLSEKHIYNYRKIITNRTVTDMNFLAVDDATKRAELKLCGLIATNHLPFSVMDTLAPLLTNIFPDSKIAAKIAMKRTKATAVLKESLGKVFKKQLSETLAKPGTFFSLIMDETTDKSTTKQCAFTVIFFCENTNRVVTRFFDIVEMNTGSNAVALYDCLKKVILEKNIPFSNLVGFSSDTTNVMFGQHNSVVSLLKKESPHIVFIKCSCHLIHLAASNACKILPRSIEDLMRNVGSHFSRSAGRQEHFKDFQEFFSTEINRILLPANTRWLSVKQCVDRILEQYDALDAYFREYVFTDPSKTAEDILNTFSNKFTKVYLEFMSYTLGLLTEFNKLFQSETPLLYKLKPETETLLQTLCANYMKRQSMQNKNLFNLYHGNPDFFCPLEEIYLGIAASETIADLRQHAPADDVSLFYKNCLRFYIELVSEIKSRFIFEDELFEVVDIVDPVKSQTFSVKTLTKVMKRFSILKKFVDCQQLDNEWRDHAFMNFKELDMDPSRHAEEYWKHVFEFRNAAGVPRFQNLQIVIRFLLILPFSNASVERIFSDLNNTKTDNRSNLHTDTIAALLHTKKGIYESGGVIKFEPNLDMLRAKLWQKKPM